MRIGFVLISLVIQLTVTVVAHCQSIPPVAQQDARALEIINSTVLAAGGPDSIIAIEDYRASGVIDYKSRPTRGGSVEIGVLLPSCLLMKTTTPTGTEISSVMHGDVKTRNENG